MPVSRKISFPKFVENTLKCLYSQVGFSFLLSFLYRCASESGAPLKGMPRFSLSARKSHLHHVLIHVFMLSKIVRLWRERVTLESCSHLCYHVVEACRIERMAKTRCSNFSKWNALPRNLVLLAEPRSDRASRIDNPYGVRHVT